MINIKKIKNTIQKIEKKIQRKIRVHHFLYPLIGGFGIVCFWYGIWGIISKIISPITGVIVGIIIMYVLGIFALQMVGEKEITDEVEKFDKKEKKVLYDINIEKEFDEKKKEIIEDLSYNK